jgi:hypothetical protein
VTSGDGARGLVAARFSTLRDFDSLTGGQVVVAWLSLYQLIVLFYALAQLDCSVSAQVVGTFQQNYHGLCTIATAPVLQKASQAHNRCQ